MFHDMCLFILIQFYLYLKTKKAPKFLCFVIWLRGPDLNRRPSGYEPDELPGCSTPRHRTALFHQILIGCGGRI